VGRKFSCSAISSPSSYTLYCAGPLIIAAGCLSLISPLVHVSVGVIVIVIVIVILFQERVVPISSPLSCPSVRIERTALS
jgi:hypothetical protein